MEASVFSSMQHTHTMASTTLKETIKHQWLHWEVHYGSWLDSLSAQSDTPLLPPLTSNDDRNKATYRPERIAVETVSMMIALHPDVTARHLDVAVFVSHGSRKEQHSQ